MHSSFLTSHMLPRGRRRHPETPAAEAVLDGRRPGTRAVDHGAERIPLRCLIVDDSARFCQAARGLLEREGLTVVGVAASSAEALELAAALRPDVVLVDIVLGAESGFELAQRLVDADPDGRSSVILISTHAEADFADLIGDSAAAGFLPKAELSASAIRSIHDSRPRG
jgi:DNA-binding NarL/FixJ family response regulator